MSGPGVVDVVGTANIADWISDAEAERALTIFIGEHPELAGLEEWGVSRDRILERLLAHTLLKWARPAGGRGGPVLYDGSRYQLLHCRGVVIAKAGFMGHLPGRRDTLPPSYATVAVFQDEVLDEEVTLVVIHLTAEVQVGARYRPDSDHAERVRRHRKERRGASRVVRAQQRAGRRVYVVGDTNFDGMPLPPLTPCWAGHAAQEKAGTLGGRTVDYVYAPDRATTVRVIKTPSDHKAVVATYRRQEK